MCRFAWSGWMLQRLLRDAFFWVACIAIDFIIIWLQHEQFSLTTFCAWHSTVTSWLLSFFLLVHWSSTSSPARQEPGLPFFYPLCYSVFPCCAPLPTHTHCPKSSEGHPGAQWVAVMSSNEPIDNLSTDWLVLQALTMCFTEHFLAQAASSLLDMSPAMPSMWA